jgi:hypothetical protein
VFEYQLLLKDLETMAQDGDRDSGGVKLEKIKVAVDLYDEINETTDSRVLNDPEIKRRLPVLQVYHDAVDVWFTLRRRWEEDTQSRKPKVVVADYQVFAQRGLVQVAENAGIEITENTIFLLRQYPYPVKLAQWLIIRSLADLFYFLLKQGYRIGQGKEYSVMKQTLSDKVVDGEKVVK